MVELQADPALSVSSLAALLMVSQSTVSRAITALTKRGLVNVSPEEGDRRRKNIHLTEAGLETIHKTDTFANALLTRWKKHVTNKEFQDIVTLLDLLASGMGALQSKPRPNESPYRVAQRRVTRAYGLIGASVYGTNLTSLEWQVLQFLSLSKFPSSAGELALYFGSPPNSITTTLNKFEVEKLVTRTGSIEDKRRVSVILTKRGSDYCKEIEERFCTQSSEILKDSSHSFINETLKALKKFTDGVAGTILFPILQEYSYSEISSKRDKNYFRATLVQWCVSASEHSHLPAVLFDTSKKCFVGRRGGKEVLLLQCNSDGSAVEIVASDGSLSRNLEYMIVEHMLADTNLKGLKKSSVNWEPWKRLWRGQ